MYNCEICGKPVPDYKPEYCCPGTIWDECGCGGRPINPCVCSDKCWNALMNGIGKTIEERRIDAGIAKWEDLNKAFEAVESHDIKVSAAWKDGECIIREGKVVSEVIDRFEDDNFFLSNF